MFNNLKIDLGTESRVRPVAEDFDTLGAYAEVVAATEDLERVCIQDTLLNLSISNVEKGQELAAAVADATGDQGVAVAVGAESLRSALSVIGQDKMSVVMVGAESLAAGTEGIADILKSMWEKTKEIAKKVWEFIRNLLAKITNFVKGIFGKAEDTAEVILKLVKKAKADGRTQLKVNEYSEDVQKRLAKEYGALLAAGFTIDESTITTFINDFKEAIVEVDTNDTKDFLLDENAIGNISNMFNNFSKDSKAGLESDELEKIINELMPFTTKLKKGITYEDDTEKLVKKYDTNGVIDDAIGDEIAATNVTVTSVLPNKVTFALVTISDDSYTAITNLKDGKDFEGKLIKESDNAKSAISTLVNKIRGGISTKTVTITPAEDEYMDNKDKVVPLELTDAETIAKTLKEAGKNLTKKLNSYTKLTDKATKEDGKLYDKYLKQLSKEVDEIDIKYRTRIKGDVTIEGDKSKSHFKTFGTSVLKLLETVSSNRRNYTKELVVGMTAIANELARSKFTHTIKESERLWVKK